MSDETLQFAVTNDTIYFFFRGLYWDGERVSLVFFQVTRQRSLLIWRTVQSCLFQGNNAECSVIGIQCVFPFLMVTVLCWDEIVS